MIKKGDIAKELVLQVSNEIVYDIISSVAEEGKCGLYDLFTAQIVDYTPTVETYEEVVEKISERYSLKDNSDYIFFESWFRNWPIAMISLYVIMNSNKLEENEKNNVTRAKR